MADKPKSLSDELSTIRSNRGVPKGDPAAAKERNLKMAKAAGLATSVLKARHKEEFDGLYQQAKRELGL